MQHLSLVGKHEGLCIRRLGTAGLCRIHNARIVEH